MTGMEMLVIGIAMWISGFVSGYAVHQRLTIQWMEKVLGKRK